MDSVNGPRISICIPSIRMPAWYWPRRAFADEMFYLYYIPCKTEHNFCNLGKYHTKYILREDSAASFAVSGDLCIWNHGNLPTLFLYVPLELVANVSQIVHKSMYSTILIINNCMQLF